MDANETNDGVDGANVTNDAEDGVDGANVTNDAAEQMGLDGWLAGQHVEQWCIAGPGDYSYVNMAHEMTIYIEPRHNEISWNTFQGTHAHAFIHIPQGHTLSGTQRIQSASAARVEVPDGRQGFVYVFDLLRIPVAGVYQYQMCICKPIQQGNETILELTSDPIEIALAN